jgi:RND family efflux transporter MFP subunit
MVHNAFSEEEFESEEALAIEQFGASEAKSKALENRGQALYNTDIIGNKQINQKEPASCPKPFLDDNMIRKSLVRKPLGKWLDRWPVVLISIVYGTAIAFCGMVILSHPSAKKPSRAQQNQSQTVGQSITVEPARLTRIARTILVTGTVAARDDLIPVFPQTTSLQIKQVLVKEGDFVQAGQVMAVLDQSVLRTQLDQAQAQFESAIAVVQERLADRAQAQAKLADAQRQLRRYQALASAGAISHQDLDTRATTAATALDALRVVQANISSAQAEVRFNAAHVEQLRTQLLQTIVRAPVSGVVAEKIAQIGDVASTQKLFSIIRNGLLEVQAQVPEIQLPQVKINALAKITSAADSRVRLQGKVREIAPLVDSQNRQAKVKINLPLTQLLRPGQFVQAAITTNSTTSLTVPAQSVLSPATGGRIVFLLLGNGTVSAQPVQVGEIVKGNQVEIKQGLKVGDRVAVTGAGFLNNGDRVQVVMQPTVTPNHEPQ